MSGTELSIALLSMPEEYDLVIIDSGAGRSSPHGSGDPVDQKFGLDEI